MSDNIAIRQWLERGENLPTFMRDFHEQKDIFKGMHELYREDLGKNENMPSVVDAHIYIVDYFLWYMGSRGYTLQKSRKKLKFPNFHIQIKHRNDLLSGIANDE